MVYLLTHRKPKPRFDRRIENRRSSDDPIIIWRGQSRGPATPAEGWLLNESSGGRRVILEQILKVGEPISLQHGDDDPRQPARVVWVTPHRDGCIAGIAFGWPTSPPIPTS